MEKEFVPYELAVKLKALGFDEPCFAAYSEDEDVSNLFIYWNDLADMSALFISQDNCEKFNYECLAPTFSQAFRWFRKNHGLSAIVSQFGYSIENGFGGIEYYIDEDENPICYEEAELACLEKLIEIVKQKNEK